MLAGAAAGALIALFASGKLSSEGDHAPAIQLPPAELGAFLRGLSVDSISSALKGFSCGSTTPEPGEDPRTFYQCTLARDDGRGSFRVRLVGPDDERIAAITTTLDAEEISQRLMLAKWAEIATGFHYDGSIARLARRWALGALSTRGSTAIGDAYLRLDTDVAGHYRLQIRARGDQPAPAERPSADKIAERFAPILRLSDDELDPEPFRPMPIDAFVDTTRLVRFAVVGANVARRQVVREHALPDDLLRPPPRCGRAFKACYFALDIYDRERRRNLVPASPGGFADLQRRLDPWPTVYWHLVQSRTGTTIQYWFLYLFNDFSVNQHEGDWEHVAVHADPNLVPVAAFYSSHHGGTAKLWPALTEGLNRRGDHPIVNVARGSHANYFGTGAHAIRECRGGFCGSGLDFIATDVQELNPGDYDLLPLEGRAFTGTFGTGNFIFRGRLLLSLAEPAVKDPRARDEWTQPLEELASTPPAR